MSGIVGIINLDGEPVDRELLGRMTDYMAFRGPDAQHIWIDGNVGFGYTQLKTTWEMELEHQPFTLDGQVWVVADARIDDRETLAQKLEIPFRPLTGNPPSDRTELEGVVTDVELILRAYLKWGDECVQHLLGDFSFAIWDGRKQRLFCARDQFGVKLFYYSHIGNCLIISNTLNCIRQHPKVTAQLNEAAIGDFLLFDMNYNLKTTFFVDVLRLPAAHDLTCEKNALEIKHFWTLKIPDLVRFRNSQDYIDRFSELMQKAVKDRLRLNKVSISLSGGLDSTTIAATALDVARNQRQFLDLQAFTVVYDQLIPDEERHYSSIAANALNIPIHYMALDSYNLYEGWETSDLHTPEPLHNPLSIIGLSRFRKIATHSRVSLTGEGGDEVFQPTTLFELFKYLPFTYLIKDVANCFFKHNIGIPIGSGLYTKIRRWLNNPSIDEVDFPIFPSWLNPDFSSRCDLSSRWDQIQINQLNTRNIIKYRSYQRLTAPIWIRLFEENGFWSGKAGVEERYPFLDLRLLNYLLALPPIPWCITKELLRLYLGGKLPNDITKRPKTLLADSTITTRIKRDNYPIKHLESLAELKPYVETSILINQLNSTDRTIFNTWECLRANSMLQWLSQPDISASSK